MLKKYITAATFLTLMIFALTVSAQKVAFTSYQLEHPIKLKGGKILFNPLKNNGKETSIDINGYVQQALDKKFKPVSGSPETNPFVWVTKPWFEKATNAKEASVVVSGSFKISAETEIEQHQFYETWSALSNPIPYFEVRPKNKVVAEVIISYQYTDKTMDYDTISYNEESERKAGRRMKGLMDMVKTCENTLKYEINNCFHLVNYEEAKYQLEKVKISDKALKEEWKGSGDLLKDHDIMKLGNLCKRIYEDSPSKEAAFNLGICYERVGNYPKATEFYKKMPEFHTIARMKKQLILFDYLHEIGVETELVDF